MTILRRKEAVTTIRSIFHRRTLHELRRFLRPILIVLLISLIFSFCTLRMVRQESVRLIEKSSDYFLENIDGRLSDLAVYSNTLSNYDPAAALRSCTPADVGTVEFHTSAFKLSDYIYHFCVGNPMIQDVVFYFPKSDSLVCRTGSLTTQQYCALCNPDAVVTGEIYERWFDGHFNHRDSGFFSVYDERTGNTEFCFFCSTPNRAGPQDASQIMLFRFSQYTVKNMMKELAELMGQEYVAMVTQDDHIYLQVGSSSGQDPADIVENFREEGHSVRVLSSKLWKMDLYFAQSFSRTETFVRTLAAIQVGGFALALLCALVLILIEYAAIMKKSYPLLQKTGGLEKERDVYDAITERLDHFYDENLQNILVIERQRLLLVDSCLKNALHSNKSTGAELTRYFSDFDISFQNDSFTVFIHPFFEQRPQEQDDRLAEKLIEFNADSCDVYCCRLEKGYVFLCNYDSTDSGRTALAAFEDVLTGQLGLTLQKSKCQLFTLDEALDECRILYQLATGSPAGEPYDAENIVPRIIDALKNDTETAKAMLSVLEEQFDGADGNAMLCLRYSFLSELYRLPEFQTDPAVPDRIYTRLSEPDWLQPLEEYLDQKQSGAVKPGKSAVVQAARIISNEYANRDMGLSMIAQRLGFSQSYLSRAFKQAYGINITYYLNKTRIDHAKELMRNGDDNLNTIAMKVGFMNDMSLIRVFKKMENETPGVFRSRASGTDVPDEGGDASAQAADFGGDVPEDGE